MNRSRSEGLIILGLVITFWGIGMLIDQRSGWEYLTAAGVLLIALNMWQRYVRKN